nr:hypothetical protein PJ912_16710 [Pectobacterium colocasium]
MSAFDYVNQHYGVNACVGRRVIAYGHPGTIVRDFGQYIGVVLDDDPNSPPDRYHPTDGIIYGDILLITAHLKLTLGKPKRREIGKSILMPIMGIEILPNGWVSTLHALTTIVVAENGVCIGTGIIRSQASTASGAKQRKQQRPVIKKR